MPTESSVEDAVQFFLNETKCLVDTPDTLQALSFMADFYQFHRIKDAVDIDSDIILLQWGSMRPPLDCGPVDLRCVDTEDCSLDPDYEQEDEEHYWIGLTRQVYAPECPNDADFDGEAIGMDIMLYFAVVQNSATEPLSGDIWLDNSSVPIDFVETLLSEGVDLASFGPLYCVAVDVGTVG